jgi:hypothetical protein
MGKRSLFRSHRAGKNPAFSIVMKSSMKNGLLILASVAAFLGMLVLPACAPASPEYLSPVPNAQYVSNGATIIIRYGPVLAEENVASLNFVVQGSNSGLHAGQKILADDHRTVIFKPSQPFTPGEEVKVAVSSLRLDIHTSFDPISYSFTVAVKQASGSPGAATTPPPANPPASAFPDYLTLPKDIPRYSVTTSPADTGEGYFFVAPFYWTSSVVGSYLLILDQTGEIVYYQSAANDQIGFDFKLQPNGLLSYFSQKDAAYYLMNSHYQIVDKYTAGEGYAADLHDFQVLPNGNALLMIYDSEAVDMSKIIKGGKKDATVTGLVIQEMDPSKNVIFEWRSWDHFSLFDSTADLTAEQIDAVHGNSLALTNDGNLLLSSRNLSEITKIDLQTGAILWRLGGKKNMFKFIGDAQPFAFQHDVRQLADGHITVFDNHGDAAEHDTAPSRGMEYRIDETNKTATNVWEFTHNPPVFATYMGDTQRLADGNTVLGWGAPYTGAGYAFATISEVTPDAKTIFELTFVQPYVSYRAFRFPWHGSPDTLPDLAYRADASGLTLGYSWNGATEVASYKLYGGNSANSLNLIDAKAKAGFETQSRLMGLPKSICYFQVAALDRNGAEMARSKVISTDQAICPLIS